MPKQFASLLLCMMMVTLAQAQQPTQPAKGADGNPLGQPYSQELVEAYRFRTQMSSDPQCQQIAMEADKVFVDGTLDDQKQIATLKQLAARARALSCI
jgi:hypothetical protein